MQSIVAIIIYEVKVFTVIINLDTVRTEKINMKKGNTPIIIPIMKF